MKIFILVLLVAVLFYVDSAGATTCGDNERPVSCRNWNERNVSCDEGSCYSPTPLSSCPRCVCFLEDNGGSDCKTMCACSGGTLRQPNGKCQEPSDCPPGSPGSEMTPDGKEDRK
uniref:Putative til domain protein n=1 Tax=Ixodes ricinus TaxID=34613 RepID=A0A0K8RCW1_IXORI